MHRIQTYLGGKRKDRNNVEISGDYDLVKTLTDNVLESVYWLKDKGVHLIVRLWICLWVLYGVVVINQ